MFSNVHVTSGQVLENFRKSLESGRKSSENHQKRRHQYVYIIKKILHVSSKIWILCSRGKKNISLVCWAHSWDIVLPQEHKIGIFSPPINFSRYQFLCEQTDVFKLLIMSYTGCSPIFKQALLLIAFPHNQKLITCWIGFPLPFHDIKCRGKHSFLKVIHPFLKTFTVSVTFFPVTSPISKTFASLALVLHVHHAICRYMFTAGFQYNFSADNS